MLPKWVHAQNPIVVKTIQDKAVWQPWGANLQYITSTFNMLSSSHPMSISVGKERIFRFIFDSIALPDSGANYVESQGFVTYSVRPKPGVLPNTVVNNYAHIFFDFNDPVTTNNAFITYVTSVPTYINHQEVTNIKYYPNPTTGDLYIALENYISDKQIELQLTDVSGKLIRSEIQYLNESNTIHTRVNDLPSGLYLINLISEDVLIGTAKVVVK